MVRQPGTTGHSVPPIPRTRLIGREEDVRDVISRLASAHLVTLTGTGGVGKTRLALQVAEELAEDYEHGAWFVDLAPRADAQRVPDAVRKALGMPPVDAGLDPAPPGKAYAVWVNADGAASPAGLFQVEPDGRAAFRLPALEQMTRVRSFSVTLEPASGTPAPTGPVVLAGPVS